MSFSKQLFDIYFDIAHWSSVLSYIMPVLGVAAFGLQEMTFVNAELAKRILAEKALRRSEERYELALEAAGLGTWDWDIAAGCVHVCERLGKLTGYAVNDTHLDVGT
ncbi:MAG: hypothetical protein KAY24_05885 [Candidatus Eisenbacteria sp.]|nr:hypothetical protein [Candidatus Eisenbacteria bacterium]